MARLHYATHLNATRSNLLRRIFTFSITDWRVSAYSLIVISFFLILFSNRSHGDEYTGLPHEDPKDLGAPASPSTEPEFAPLPGWARGVKLAALPYQLTPMGKKPVTETTVTISHESLAPPKDTTPAVLIPMPASTPKPATTAPETPTLIAVSPFLQWIKSNPQAAAAEARQQAANENAPPAPPTPPSPNQPNSPSSNPYWLPPLIDSGEFGVGAIPGGAAIYTTPQR